VLTSPYQYKKSNAIHPMPPTTQMYPLVRCTGCNKVIGNFWEEFYEDYRKVTDFDYAAIWQKYNVIRMCCKNSLMSNMELWKALV
jgi:DNA-directed RNA polymerase subunit N (RpoN/RPB10)